VGKKKKRGDVVTFPVGRAQPAQQQAADRKLSELIKELALRLLKRPEAASSLPAVEATILLASAAWNAALGDSVLRDQHRDLLKKFEWGAATPGPEMVSTDTEQMIATLIKYKRAHYPNDQRIVKAVETSPDGNVRVHWMEGNPPVTAPFRAQPQPPAPARSTGSHPLAKALVSKMKAYVGSKLVNLEEVVAGRSAARELQKTVATRKDLAGFHPAHAIYVYAQNQVSVMSEQLTALDEMAPFLKLFSEAEDEYMPSGSPMSPLTTSFFTCWAFFDVCTGTDSETIGTTAMEVGRAFGMHAELVRVIDLMQQSRMGLYVNEGTDGDLVVLRELATDATCHTVVPPGYRGQKGELWYVRVLPPPLPGATEHVAFTTPYLILRPELRDWEAYFRRVLPDAPRQARLDTYDRHMKFGPTPRYWTEYVFEAYVNHRNDVIFLRGLPDVEESRPHSRVNR